MLKRVFIASSIIFLISGGVVSGHTWHVNPDGSGDFETIRDALIRACWGDSVIVACGTYHESGLSLATGVDLLSETECEDCVEIDADGGYYVIFCGANSDSTTTMTGFTLTGASRFALYLESHSNGKLRHLVIEDNERGMFLSGGASPILSNVKVIGNVGTGRGCGIFGDENGNHLTLRDCLFLDNAGGAIWLTRLVSVSLTDVEFVGNAAGIQLNEASGEVTRFTFRENGLAVGLQGCYPGPLTFDECVFDRNGTGIYLMGGVPLVTNCLFSGNSGLGAIYIDPGSPTIRGCTFALNSGSRGSAIEILETEPYFGPCIIENTIMA
jgi:hypothetical protein